MTETCLSLPFGDALNCSGGIDPREHHFTGKERDTESGLDYFGARYNFFMLGPAYNIERSPGKLVFDTSPTVRVASCPPNRVAPLLLTFVRSGGVIEGDFVDDEIKQASGDEVSLKIAVGSEPYKVVEEAKRFYNSNCKHSPYDAIVNWATFLESNSIHVP
jgi:hypothetical protein